ncbi:MAG: DUF5723 family protein [Bacteroidales bacterium]|jgi:hypothetical protein
MKCFRVGIWSFFLAVLLYGNRGFSQEMFGATLGNYSGVNGLQLNPSSILGSKTFLDVNLLALDVSLQNNFVYMDKTQYKLYNFFTSGFVLPSHPEQYGTEFRNFYTYDNDHVRDFNLQLRLNGPGAMLVYGNQAFAITTGVRSVVSGKNVPYELANFAYLGLSYLPQQNIEYKDNRPFKAGELTWANIGISYAYTITARNFRKITIGITVNRLFGYSGVYVYGNKVDYVVPNDTSVSVHNFKGQVGYSLPVNYNQNGLWNGKLFPGHGFSGDIGATYTRLSGIYSEDYFTTLCSQQYNDYLYRLGVSLIDIGAIRFNTHSENYSIDNKSAYWSDLDKFHFSSIQQMMDTISYQFYGDKKAAYKGNSFYMWLPSALSVQFDYHYFKQWYVNASLVYGFDLSHASVSRPSELSITPRYETRAFEADLPVSLYDWERLRIGLALRYYYFTIGTEKLGEFFRISNFTGMDLYFAFHFFIDKGNCPKGKQKGCQEIDYRIKSDYR